MILFISFLVILAMLSTKISDKFGLPLLIGFILIGVLVGSDVLNLFYFDNAILTKKIADILLIFIIFDGGFCITQETFKRVAGPSMTLATFGVAVTSVALGFSIHLLLKFDLTYSMLIASIISSTDAAGVFMITKANPIKDKLAATLNVESAANDPMAILLTLTFVHISTGAFKTPALAVAQLIWQFAGGIFIGFLAFKIAVYLFNRLESDNRGNYNVLMLGCILLAYGGAELVQANGIIAVFFAGYWIGNTAFPAKRSVGNFLESISTIFNITLFIMLGLLSFPHRFVHIWKESLIIVAVMMFVARPIAVLLSVIPFHYTRKEKFFITWGGIKGAVPIVLATYPLANGLDENGFIFDTIFFAVILSCIIQGTTLAPLARLLKFTDPKKPESLYAVELYSLKASDIDIFDVYIEDYAASIGKRIIDLNLGKDILISSIVRDGKIIFPKGDTVIEKNDILYILAHTAKIKSITAQLNEQEA